MGGRYCGLGRDRPDASGGSKKEEGPSWDGVVNESLLEVGRWLLLCGTVLEGFRCPSPESGREIDIRLGGRSSIPIDGLRDFRNIALVWAFILFIH